MSKVAHRVSAFPHFPSRKRLGVFLLPLDGMLVHCKAYCQYYASQYPFIHLGEERGTASVKSSATVKVILISSVSNLHMQVSNVSLWRPPLRFNVHTINRHTYVVVSLDTKTLPKITTKIQMRITTNWMIMYDPYLIQLCLQCHCHHHCHHYFNFA